jgi:NTE family protein
MSTDDAASRKRRVELALCLSGGGYRAALFHLGAFWRLAELRLLRRVERVSSVSGGSIIAAWLASRIMADRAGSDARSFADWCDALDPRSGLVEPFYAVAATDIRTLPALVNLLPNLIWHRFGAGDLERAYARLLTPAPLAELPRAPDFVFCATDLTFGVNFEFSRSRVGDYQAGYLVRGERDPAAIPIARAVAASSCFPPVFGPLRLDASGYRFRHGRYRGDDGDALRQRIDLTDGGVYDNLATEPVIKHAAALLISDAGAPFPFQPGGHVLRRLMRYTAVIGNQAVALRKRLFVSLRQAERLDGALWNLARSHDPGAFGYSEALIEGVIARIRTDLDHFTRAEFELLVNHGYASATAALHGRSELVPESDDCEPRWPYPGRIDEAAARHALRVSHRRFVFARWLVGLTRRVE